MIFGSQSAGRFWKTVYADGFFVEVQPAKMMAPRKIEAAGKRDLCMAKLNPVARANAITNLAEFGGWKFSKVILAVLMQRGFNLTGRRNFLS
jgi:hypothetical protein